MSNPKVTIRFSTGDSVNLELYPDIAPKSVENFLRYAKRGFYDDTIMHRVIEGFMIQGGGFSLEGKSLKRKGTFDPIKGEFSSNGVKNNLSHKAGVISCARTMVNNSATSQFFICSADADYLDGNYAAFGCVTDKESLDAVVRISKVPTYTMDGMQNFPRTPVVITAVDVIE